MNRESNRSLAALVALGVGIAGCAGSMAPPQNPEGVTTITSGPTTVTVVGPDTPALSGDSPAGAPDSSGDAKPASAAVLSDAQIVAVVDAAGHAERELARDALKRAQSDRVRQVAQRVVSDHVAARLEELEKGLSPQPSPTSTELQASGARTMNGVRDASGADLDRVYLEALRGEETAFLQVLDGTLIPQARDAKLKSLLKDLRVSVASRMAMGEDAHAAPAAP